MGVQNVCLGYHIEHPSPVEILLLIAKSVSFAGKTFLPTDYSALVQIQGFNKHVLSIVIHDDLVIGDDHADSILSDGSICGTITDIINDLTFHHVHDKSIRIASPICCPYSIFVCTFYLHNGDDLSDAVDPASVKLCSSWIPKLIAAGRWPNTPLSSCLRINVNCCS